MNVRAGRIVFMSFERDESAIKNETHRRNLKQKNEIHEIRSIQ